MDDFCDAHSGMLTDIANLKVDKDEQWKAINELRNRLPAWATVVMSLLSGISGYAIAYATLAHKIGGGG